MRGFERNRPTTVGVIWAIILYLYRKQVLFPKQTSQGCRVMIFMTGECLVMGYLYYCNFWYNCYVIL